MPQKLKCQRCTTEFECSAKDDTLCQCNEVTISTETQAFLSRSYYGCLCNSCLTEMDEMVKSSEGKEYPKMAMDMVEGEHYYKQNGYKVFTEKFHYLRGHCCQNKCKHCAYGFDK